MRPWGDTCGHFHASHPADHDRGHELSLPLDDLEPLDRLIGNARFVGVGEPIHTGGGFYQLKARVFRYLVESQGFRVLGWEAPFFWVEQLDAFLGRCDQPVALWLVVEAD